MKIKKLDSRKDFTNYIITTDFGYFRFRRYNDNVVVGMGAYINKDLRKEGHFKEIFEFFLSTLTPKTKVHFALSEEKLINYFKSKGFKKAKSVRYWKNPSNATTMVLIIPNHGSSIISILINYFKQLFNGE